MLIIILQEQQAYKFVQFSDLAENYTSNCISITCIVNISVAPPLYQKKINKEES